jgi:hypothetical protein
LNIFIFKYRIQSKINMEKKLGINLKWYEKPFYSVLLRKRASLPVFMVRMRCPVTGEVLDKDLAVLKPSYGKSRKRNLFVMNLYSAISTLGVERCIFGLDTAAIETGVRVDPLKNILTEMEHVGYSTDKKFEKVHWSFDAKRR